MKFETVVSGGCRSYLVGCEETCAAALIDPELSQIDRYIALAAQRWAAHPVSGRHPHARRSFLGHPAARAPARRAGGDASRQPGAVRRSAAARRRNAGGRKAAAAGAAHSGAHARFDVPVGRGPGVHRRHAAHRRNRAHRPAERRRRGALREPVRRPAQARSGAEGLSGARIQGALELDASARNWPRTRGCRSAIAPRSSR